MLFRRRVKPTFSEKLRTVLWPRRSFRRSGRYIVKRVLRLNATPHAIAAGFAAGIFASFTPFLGFHFLIAFAISYVIAGNMASAAIGCGVGGNPLTFTPIWAATYELGRWIIAAEPMDGRAPGSLAHQLTHMSLLDLWTPILKPMLVGSVPLGLLFGLAGYALVYLAARSFQLARARRLAALRESRREALGTVGGVR